jgi:hypothetical protein
MHTFSPFSAQLRQQYGCRVLLDLQLQSIPPVTTSRLLMAARSRTVHPRPTARGSLRSQLRAVRALRHLRHSVTALSHRSSATSATPIPPPTAPSWRSPRRAATCSAALPAPPRHQQASSRGGAFRALSAASYTTCNPVRTLRRQSTGSAVRLSRPNNAAEAQCRAPGRNAGSSPGWALTP